MTSEFLEVCTLAKTILRIAYNRLVLYISLAFYAKSSIKIRVLKMQDLKVIVWRLVLQLTIWVIHTVNNFCVQLDKHMLTLNQSGHV